MVTIVFGVGLGCFVQLKFEVEEGNFQSTGIGIGLLFLSVLTDGIQHVIEERLYKKDP